LAPGLNGGDPTHEALDAFEMLPVAAGLPRPLLLAASLSLLGTRFLLVELLSADDVGQAFFFCFCKYWQTLVANECRSAFLSGCHSNISLFMALMRSTSGNFSKSFISSPTFASTASRNCSSACSAARRSPSA